MLMGLWPAPNAEPSRCWVIYSFSAELCTRLSCRCWWSALIGAQRFTVYPFPPSPSPTLHLTGHNTEVAWLVHTVPPVMEMGSPTRSSDPNLPVLPNVRLSHVHLFRTPCLLPLKGLDHRILILLECASPLMPSSKYHLVWGDFMPQSLAQASVIVKKQR